MDKKGEIMLVEFAKKANLSVRAYNTLARARCNTLSDVISIAEDGKLLDIRRCGIKTANEICDAIFAETGKYFKDRQRKQISLSEDDIMACEKCAYSIIPKEPFSLDPICCYKHPALKIKKDFFCGDYSRRGKNG